MWLRADGVDWTDVVDRRRTDSGLRWFAGPGIERALHTLSGYVDNQPGEPVDASNRQPTIVFRTLRIERNWELFPDGVVDLPRRVEQLSPRTAWPEFAERGEVHIERIEHASPEMNAMPEGCGEHGRWVRGRYDDKPGLERPHLEEMAMGRVMVEFGVATVWEKRVALGPALRRQLAAEQAFPGVDGADGWYPVPDAPVHRYVRELGIDGRPVKVPPEIALRTCYLLTCTQKDNEEERTLEALRGEPKLA